MCVCVCVCVCVRAHLPYLIDGIPLEEMKTSSWANPAFVSCMSVANSTIYSLLWVWPYLTTPNSWPNQLKSACYGPGSDCGECAKLSGPHLDKCTCHCLFLLCCQRWGLLASGHHVKLQGLQ